MLASALLWSAILAQSPDRDADRVRRFAESPAARSVPFDVGGSRSVRFLPRPDVVREPPTTTSPGFGPLGLRPIRRSQFYPWVISGALSAAAAALVLGRPDTKPRR